MNFLGAWLKGDESRLRGQPVLPICRGEVKRSAFGRLNLATKTHSRGFAFLFDELGSFEA